MFRIKLDTNGNRISGLSYRLLLGASLLTVLASPAGADTPLFRPHPLAPPLGHYWVKVGDGSVGFYLGMRSEPAYALEPNGIELYGYADITAYDSDGYPVDGRRLEPGNPAFPGDQLDIEASYELLANGNPNGKVIAQKKLGKIELRHSEIGYYLTEFIPNPAGRYAIKFKGTVNGQKVDDRVVCAYEDEEPHTFSCIETRVPRVL